MTDICSLPEFTIAQVAEIARRLYGLNGPLKLLNGERDLNYLLTTENGRYVIKIANQDESYGMLECQHQVLQRLLANKVMPQQASSLESVNGKVIEIATSDNDIDHYCRVLSYIDGRLLSSLKSHSPGLLCNLGKILALIDQSLQGFTHESLDRPLLWNMSDALTTLERFKPLLDSDDKRNLINFFEAHFRDSVLPLADKLRQAAIHNDANDNNILVEEGPETGQRITSIIDFGDMVNSWLAAEPAIAAAYAMLGKDNPIETAVAIVKGYHSQLALNEAEISVLFDFIAMRLCMSVCICAYQRSIEPGNEYLSISEQPAWELLEKLRGEAPESVAMLFRDACKG